MPARAPRFRLEPPAGAASPPAPAAPPAEPTERGRAPYAVELRAMRMRMGAPLSLLHLRRIEQLEQLVGARYCGWGREGKASGPGPDSVWVNPTWEDYFVDVLDVDDLEGSPSRYTGETLHLALGAAIRAARGQR